MEFEKILSKNDVGATKSHQAGFLVPKSLKALLDFFPTLDSKELNPSKPLTVVDDDGNEWGFRYVYYNNKLHSATGTRDEYRITCTTKYMRRLGASEGDILRFSRISEGVYRVSLVAKLIDTEASINRVTLRGWHRVY